MKLDKNYKVRVTPEQSRKIQGLLFDCGFQWAMTGQTIHSDREIILIEPDKLRLLNGAKSTLKFYIEIAADDLIALLTDLSKSAENPLQGMELTPEFEAVATHVSHPSNNDTYVGEPQFKAGDKVYAPSVGSKIYTVKDVGGDWCYPLRIYCNYDDDHEFTKEGLITAEGLPVLFLATELNHALLSQLYPNIKFEAPPKELTGSDLAMALIKKGWVGFNCLCGNSGDENAITETIVTGVNNSGQFTTIDGNLFNNAIPVIGLRALEAREVGL